MDDLTEMPADALRELQPVHALAESEPTTRTGLCLSGGGYRAMLFHLGALLRLNEAGLLRGLDRVSSVSGGSITAATLGLRWHELAWGDGDVASNFEPLVVAPVRALARRTIDVPSVLGGLLPLTTIGRRVAGAYREHLFGDATLQALPVDGDRDRPAPRFVFCATNLESGALFRFSRPFLADRVLRVIDGQVRALRKRQAIGGFAARQRSGTYWGIRSRVDSYGLDDALDAHPDGTRALAETPTRLAALDDEL